MIVSASKYLRCKMKLNMPLALNNFASLPDDYLDLITTLTTEKK